MNKPARIEPAEDDFRARFSAAEFLRMCDTGAFDNMKVELINGELYRMTPPFTQHARLQGEVLYTLRTLLLDQPDLIVFTEVGIILGDMSVVGCDCAVARIGVGENRMLAPGEVLLAVEVAMTSFAKDNGVKRLAYAAAGVPEYWIVDGERKIIHRYCEPAAGDYAYVQTVSFGVPFTAFGLDDPISIA